VGEKIAANPSFFNAFLAQTSLNQSISDVADSCGPSWRALSLTAQQTGTTPDLPDLVGVLSGKGFSTDPPQPVPDDCRAWRSQQLAALSQKLQSDTRVLASVQDHPDSQALAPLYIDTAKTRIRVAVIDLKEGRKDSAKLSLGKAVTELKHAPDATELATEAQRLYDSVKQQ